GAGIAGDADVDGLVPELSSRSGATPETAGQHHDDGVVRAARFLGARRPIDARESRAESHHLFDLPPMSDVHDHESTSAIDRREFLRLAGASIALAGLDGCSRLPAENILPYVDNRPELTPGIAQYYATAMCVDGCATGLLVVSHVGRPTKIEG